MSEKQKDIIDRLLKEQKKSKRDLAKILKIKENSVNRTLRNPNISLLKLEKIAEFLEVDISDLFPKVVNEPATEYQLYSNEENKEQIAITNLSEAIKRHSRTIEIMAETEHTNVKSIESLVKIIAHRYGDIKEK